MKQFIDRSVGAYFFGPPCIFISHTFWQCRCLDRPQAPRVSV